MLRKFASAIAVAGTLTVASTAADAAIISAYFPTGSFGQIPVNAGSNELALNPVQDGFSGGTWSHSGNVQVIDPPTMAPPGGSLPGQYRSPWEGTPFEDTTGRYTSVQKDSIATLEFTDDQNFFQLYWGSGDFYNTLTFLNDDVVVGAFTGLDLNPPDDGDLSTPAVGAYVVSISGFAFDEVTFESHGLNAFEFANVQAGPGQAPAIPLPPALILLLSALFGMGYLGRRRSGTVGA